MPPYYTTDYLAHYGVLGMKWGVRHDPGRAATRTAAKARRIKKRVDRRDNVAKWATRRGVELDHFGTRGLSKRSFKLAKKANKSAIKQVAKGSKFLKAAMKEFGNTDLASLDKATCDYGNYLIDRMNSYNKQVEMSVLNTMSNPIG